MNRTARWGVPTSIALGVPLFVPTPAVAEPAAEHCYAEALTVEEVEAGATSEVTCYEEALLARGSITLAVHYSGFGGTGASLTVTGAACSGSSLSLGSSDPWNNLIHSTRNGTCANAKHFANGDLTGDNEVTSGSSGTLNDLSGSMATRVSSVGYA